MPRTAGVVFVFLAALTGCSHFKGSPSTAADVPARSSPDAQPSPQGPTAAEAAETPPATPPTGPPAAGAPVAGPPAVLPPVPSPSTAKPAQPKTAGNANSRTPRGSGSPAGGSSKPLPAEQHPSPAAAETAAPQPAAGPPAPPALDLTGLEQRLKDTHAIGLFTKLSLKNQVDDLLGAFRAFHGGHIPPPLTELRQHYDLLLLKVLTLLQDGDPPLASAILASREAIWALLADRDKFQKFQMG